MGGGTSVPLKGEICIEQCTDGSIKLKVGDGSTQYKNLKEIYDFENMRKFVYEVSNDVRKSIVQSDWKVTDSKNPAFIMNKPTIPPTPEPKITFYASDGALYTVSSAPTGASLVSQLVTKHYSKDQIIALIEAGRLNIKALNKGSFHAADSYFISNNNSLNTEWLCIPIVSDSKSHDVVYHIALNWE